MRFRTLAGLLLASLSSCLALAAPLVVIIDPGHGGRDHGTTKNGIFEANITLAVSRALFTLLKKDHRFHPQISRNDDATVSLYERARLAKAKKADIFLSIHVNSSPDVRAKGAEFYFQNQMPPDQESMYLAHLENATDADEVRQPLTYDFLDKNMGDIGNDKHQKYSPEVSSIVADLLDSDRVLRSSELVKSLKVSWKGARKGRTNGIRQAPFYVLNQMRVPSTLVELGYLTNPDDYLDLVNPKVQQNMAQDLYRGLVNYKESMDKRL